MATQAQLDARLNPTPTQVNVAGQGLFRGVGDDTAIYFRKGDTIKQLDLVGTFIPSNAERAAMGNFGNQVGNAQARLLDQTGINFDSLPKFNIGDLRQSRDSSTGQRLGAIEGNFGGANLEEFINLSKAGSTTESVNTQRNFLSGNEPRNLAFAGEGFSNEFTTEQRARFDELVSAGAPEDVAMNAVLQIGVSSDRNLQFATEEEIDRLGEGGIVERNGRQFRINPAGELIPVGGRIEGGQQEETSTSPTQPSIQDIQKQVDQMVQDILESTIESGKTISPDFKFEEIDTEEFLRQAELSVAPEFKQKFANVKSDLVRGFQNIGVDLGIQLAGVERETEQARLTGREQLAGRGLTFSGRREQFETDVTEAGQRAEEASRLASGREAIRLGTQGERLAGTERLRGLDFGVGGQTPFALSQEPQIGSIERERQFTIESLAKEEERQERERRAFTTRNLSFA